MASPAVTPPGEKKLSEFEEKMARRRALETGGESSPSPPVTPSPTKSVAELAKKFSVPKSTSPAPASSTPTSVNDIVKKFNTKSPSETPSPAKTSPSVATVINKLNAKTVATTSPVSPSALSPTSAASELASKLSARRLAVEGASPTSAAANSTTPSSPGVSKATASPSAGTSVSPTTPRMTPSRATPVTVSPGVTTALNSSGTSPAKTSGATTIATTSKATGAQTPSSAKAAGTVSSTNASKLTPLLVVSPPDPSIVSSASSVNSGRALELANKLDLKKTVVDTASPTSVSQASAKATEGKTTFSPPQRTPSAASISSASSKILISTVAARAAGRLSPETRPHASFDSPVALMTPTTSFTSASPGDIVISPASTPQQDVSTVTPDVEDSRFTESPTQQQDQQNEEIPSQAEEMNHVFRDEHEAEKQEEPLTAARRLSLALNFIRTWFSRGKENESTIRQRRKYVREYIARQPRRAIPPRELEIGKPYTASYIPEEPLSTDRTDSRMWTAVFAYVLPLVVLTVGHILQATADERAFMQLPSSVTLLASFPLNTKTAPTEWAPTGIRVTSGSSLGGTTPVMKASRAYRADDTRSGYIWISAGPRFEPSWSSEPFTLIQNGGIALDDWGNLLFCPTYTALNNEGIADDVSLVALDAHSGERRWQWSIPVVTSFFSSAPLEPPIVRAGCGTPLVLNDPVSAGAPERRMPQIVYHATRTRAHALRSSDGSNIWSAATGIAESDDFESNRMWGLAYITKHDALVGATNDGWIFVLDRSTGRPLTEVKKLPCSVPVSSSSWSDEELDKFRAAFPAATAPQLRCVLSPFATASIDSSSRLFISATSKDSGDKASLYLVEIVDGEADSQFPFRIRLAQSVQIGQTLTDLGAPVVSVDGAFVFIGDSSIEGVRAFHTANLTQVFALDELGSSDANPPALALAQDEGYGALFVKTDHTVVKVIMENPFETNWEETPPLIAWMQTFEAATGGDPGLSMRPASALSVVGNGLALAVHITTTDFPYPAHSGLPIASGIVFLDRATGSIRSFTINSAGETLNDISVGMDGSVFGVNDPIRRSKSVHVFETFSSPLSSPLTGGVVRFKPLNFLELARDASCAAGKRIDNSLQFSGGWLSSPPPGGEEAGKEDARHVAAQAWQAVVAFQIFLSSIGTRNATTFASIQTQIDLVADSVFHGTPLPQAIAPSAAFGLMRTVKPNVDAVCQELSAL